MLESRIHSISQSFELEMIKNDSHFYRDILHQVISGGSGSILSLGLLPHFSLFVVETYAYFSSELPDYARILRRQHEDILRASRTRIKLFDDDRRDIVEFLSFLRWISELHRQWFIYTHAGPHAWLKRMIQRDLGLFAYGDHLIGTTHVAFFNLGYGYENVVASKDEVEGGISPLAKAIGVEIGEYVRLLCSGFGLNTGDLQDRSHAIDDEFLCFVDVKSDRYCNSTFNGPTSPELNSCLILFLSTINFLRLVLSRLVVGVPDTFFKTKFVMLYHLASSLSKLQAYGYSADVLAGRSKVFLSEILSDKDLKRVKSSTSFRNILVHYRILRVPEDRLTHTAKLFGLVEHFFDGMSFDELDSLLDCQLGRMSAILEEWLPQTSLPTWRMQPFTQ